MYRRCALELLGISGAHDDAEESSLDGSDSDSSSDSPSGQSISSSSSEDSNDGGQEMCADVPLPPPPPLVTDAAGFRRGKGKVKFCSGFQSGCGGLHAAPSKASLASDVLRKDAEAEDAEESSEASSEDFSDISDDSDIFNLKVDPAMTWCTEQDRDQRHIAYIATLLRKNPFVPANPKDPKAEEDWEDVQSGVALPRAHCAFKGCTCVFDRKDRWEDDLKDHVLTRHLDQMQLPARDKEDAYDFYEAAIQHRAQDMMPAVGVSIDRRSHRHVTDTFNDESVYNLVCMVCAQSKTHTGLFARKRNGYRKPLVEIGYKKGADLISMWEENDKHFDANLGFRSFLARYGTDWKVQGQRDEDLREFGPNQWEWRRLLRIPESTTQLELLCCPEDVRCKSNHSAGEICSKCDVPICSTCHRLLRKQRNVPMALANDNMWGYISSAIIRYKVRWIEMAAVLPYWTCMLVYYVEADKGQLMSEELKGQQYRTAVRGHVFFHS